MPEPRAQPLLAILDGKVESEDESIHANGWELLPDYVQDDVFKMIMPDPMKFIHWEMLVKKMISQRARCRKAPPPPQPLSLLPLRLLP